MDRLVVRIHARLLECFGKCGVSVTCASNVFRTGSVFDGNNSFRNHFSSVRSDDVSSKNLVALGVGKNLDKAVGRTICSGSTVGRKWETSFLELHARFLKFLLSLANGCDLRETKQPKKTWIRWLHRPRATSSLQPSLPPGRCRSHLEWHHNSRVQHNRR
jgi:hypothetical protein